MDEGLKEYFAKLEHNFWQPGKNPKIKYELGYKEDKDIGDMAWFFSVFQKPFQPESLDLAFSVNFYRFYNELLKDEPSMQDFISLIPFSYHKVIIEKCSDAYEALAIIEKIIENDWSKIELINYFSALRN